MRSADKYQIALISLGLAATLMLAAFFKREIFPEYRIYQEDYVALEQFRSIDTGEPPAPFKNGIKQIVLNAPDNGPAQVDRCVSCHVALQIQDYSPTQIAHDINGNMELDEHGKPILEANPNYVWKKLDEKIAELRDPQLLEQLTLLGEEWQAKARLQQAEEYAKLKTAQVGEYTYDVTKVLAMHPLIGKETRPFEFHPIDEYGCLICHSGNGQGLTTDKAHGPIFDGMYEEAETGHQQIFTESDPENDPPFARMFNHMPGDKLLFQTTPLLLGPLMEAKCVQCHQSGSEAVKGAIFSTEVVSKHRSNRSKAILQSFQNSQKELLALIDLKKRIAEKGLVATEQELKLHAQDYELPNRSQIAAQWQYFQQNRYDKKSPTEALDILSAKIEEIVGSASLAQQLEKTLNQVDRDDQMNLLKEFIVQNQQNAEAKGPLFIKAAAQNLDEQLLQHVKDTETSFKTAVDDPEFLSALTTDLDLLTQNYAKGQQLYISQACYACHRIAGFSRGGVGPEHTNASTNYPWFLKESIVWPQADLPTSTMPNFRLDSEEVEKLMTFLLAQGGGNRTNSETARKIAIQEWEAGRKNAWEKPISPVQMQNVSYGMTVFATEGCASCHRLKGFDSNVGFAIEKEPHSSFNQIYAEREWFARLFTEEMLGSEIVTAIEANLDEIDRRIVNDVRQEGILEKIEQSYPGQIEALYSNFKYAFRAKNQHFTQQLALEKDPIKIKQIEQAQRAWEERVHRVLMVYIQEYGLGRLIGPRPNWSGVYRSDQWLMEHFRNPIIHAPGSIMPVFPFDDTKFYALTNMLDHLGILNRDAVKEIWRNRGFDPALAAHIYCSQCHGEFLLGNGPVSEWIYPIPKNLRNADFLRNMTKENVIKSITHGMPGTPMPPWGETATDKPTADGIPVLTKAEIQAMTDWLFSSVPGSHVIRESQEVPKWRYQVEDLIQELKDEKQELRADQDQQHSQTSAENYFDLTRNLIGPEPYQYSIKQKFYTPHNISEGKAFYVNNCAICHGSEADGSGIRAEIMQDAKPRMLINLDWQNGHDDLYMLRSIKYGVPGTSMTPWGDLTSSLQRLQLVIYIRSILSEQRNRDLLLMKIYQSFDTQQLLIERLRAQYSKDAKTDRLLIELKDQIKQEQELYRQMGFDLLQHKVSGVLFQKFIQLISLYEKRYLANNGSLKWNDQIDLNREIEMFKAEALAEIDTHQEKQAIQWRNNLIASLAAIKRLEIAQQKSLKEILRYTK